ncbi:MAG: TRAP transporter small permease [Giesbergeria sp.]|jgi:TRAP-type C4-dicarboxylate transport system permease small subunit
MKSLFRKGFDWLDMGVRTAVMAFATVMLLALSLQVFMRFVLDKPLSWSEELALACFSWSMLLAIGLGVRQKTHVRMDILVDHLPKALSLVIEKVVTLCIAGFGAFLAVAGKDYVADAVGSTSAAIGYPIVYLYACAPVCGLVIALFALEHLILGSPDKSQDELVEVNVSKG